MGGGELRDAVVTVPANSPGWARLNTRVAAGHAGINVAALLNEPTAAAMAFAQHEPDVRRVLVYDFGGGTLDVTVLQVDHGVFRERASKGIGRLGGVDLDLQLRDLALAHFGGTPSWTPGQWRQFQLDCERAKIRLSHDEVVALLTPDGLDGVEIQRSDFEAVIAPWVERSLEPVQRCLSDLQLDPEELDAVLLVGGSSQIPLVRRTLERALGRSVTDVAHCDPMTAVASGAAVAAAILNGERDDLDFAVVTEHALGTVTRDESGRKKFSTIIPRNRLLPARERRTYKPARDAQTEVIVRVIEGDPDKPVAHADTVEMAQLVFALPSARPRDDAAFTVEFLDDVSGVIHVTAKDKATGELLARNEVSFLDEETARRRTAEGIHEVEELFETAAEPFLTPGEAAEEVSVDAAATDTGGTDIPTQASPPAAEQTLESFDEDRLVLVVDGSNVASEGRAVRNGQERPSLAQLLDAVGALRATHPQAFVYVIVDANFRHRVHESELPAFEQALVDRLISLTPAGTEGRGDALVCAAAERLGATIVSNDSFKELQDRHPWLFDGRVLGAVEIGGAWLFEPRTPLRAKRGLFRRRPGSGVDEAQVESVVAEATKAGRPTPALMSSFSGKP